MIRWLSGYFAEACSLLLGLTCIIFNVYHRGLSFENAKKLAVLVDGLALGSVALRRLLAGKSVTLVAVELARTTEVGAALGLRFFGANLSGVAIAMKKKLGR